MPTTINRYPSPTFPAQAGPDDTQNQNANTYNAAIGETAGERTDFLRYHLATVQRVQLLAADTSVIIPPYAPGEHHRIVPIYMDSPPGSPSADCTIFAPVAQADGDTLEIRNPGWQIKRLFLSTAAGNFGMSDSARLGAGRILFRWVASLNFWLPQVAEVYPTLAGFPRMRAADLRSPVYVAPTVASGTNTIATYSTLVYSEGSSMEVDLAFTASRSPTTGSNDSPMLVSTEVIRSDTSESIAEAAYSFALPTEEGIAANGGIKLYPVNFRIFTGPITGVPAAGLNLTFNLKLFGGSVAGVIATRSFNGYYRTRLIPGY